jgi:bleomycin hydrolase
MPATDQADSGRCWMFGTLNLFRFGARQKLNIVNFEFSESYLYLFHLLEQTNFFLERMMEYAGRPLNDRVISMWLEEPITDGGDWSVAINLIEKYGLVPKLVFPETYTSSNTGAVTGILTDLLRGAACQIRTLLQNGHSMDDVRKFKCEIVGQAYRILCIHLGTPPTKFHWQWRDQDEVFHAKANITPQEFCRNYVTVPFESYISVFQDPRHEYYRRYTVEHSMPIDG